MVFYRKYRPQTVSDLDSEEVRTRLHSVLSSAAPTFIEVPHAFLFTGPKGLGKTSTARIVAKVVNCEKVPDVSKVPKVSKGESASDIRYGIEPCNKCQQCISITKGTNLDVFEIDAASNRGIDEIRDLKEKIRLSPVKAKKKIYIIDEVHMLTTEAFNALLKTLEEPPSHAVFILCTTEAHKIPATILSRCFHISFKRATEDELVRAFKRIVKGENLKIDEKTLKAVAKLADGGFRDGTKILEELVALSDGKEIKPELLEGTYQVTAVSQQITKLLHALEEKNLQAGIAIISDVTTTGTDFSYFLSEFVAALHELLLQKAGVPGDYQTKTALHLSEIKLLLEIFSKALLEMKYAVIPSLPLELAFVSWCQKNSEPRMYHKGTNFSEVSQTSELSKNAQEVIAKKSEEVTIATLRKQAGNLAKERAVNGESVNEKKEESETDPAEVSILKFAASGEHSQEWIDNLWKNIITEIKSHNHMIAGVLRSCRIVSYDRKVLTIEAAAKFHKERLEEAKTFEALQMVCEQLVGNPIMISITLKS